MRGSRLRVMLRRAFALGVLAALGVAAWLLLVRDSGDDDEGRRVRIPGVSAKAGKVVQGLDRSEQVDQVMLLGFEGTDASAPIVDEARERQLGGVIVGPQNGVSTELVTALTARGALRRAHPAAAGRRPTRAASTAPSRSCRPTSGRSTSATRAHPRPPRPGRPRRRPR